MKKWNKNYPVWFKINGTNVIKATILGVQQYLRETDSNSCTIVAVQFLEIENVAEEIRHPLSGVIIRKDR
jgi:heterodisulfide reductase subunit B